MAKHEHSTDDAELHESYGKPIAHPSTIKGHIENFGELAGSGSLEPKRNICFDDSIDDNLKNQPKSH
jgi:hypothetical protein